MNATAHSKVLAGLQRKRANKAKIAVNENSARNGNSTPRTTRLAEQLKRGKKISCYESRYLDQIVARIPKSHRTLLSESNEISVDVSISNLSIMVHTDGDRYVGTAENGVPHGYGCAVSTDGEMYYGEWINSSPQGEGIYFWNDGMAYKGMWHDGRRHGRGVFLSDNEAVPAEFEHGKMIRFDGEICEKVFFVRNKRKMM